MERRSQSYDYDVCLSFAGEDRAYVEEVASKLREGDIRVFYDKYEEVGLWGQDLYVHLADVYRSRARYCVLFISAAYRDKLWTNHELQSIQARVFQESQQEYLLPARFDDTELPGLHPTIGYIDLRDKSPSQLAEMIAAKVNSPPHEDDSPPRDKLVVSFTLTLDVGSAREAPREISQPQPDDATTEVGKARWNIKTMMRPLVRVIWEVAHEGFWWWLGG